MTLEMNLSDMVNFSARIPDHEMLAVLSTTVVWANPEKPFEMNDIPTMIKITEYMALGKPIVQFDSNEGRLSAKEASPYVEKENAVNDFVKKIIWLLGNAHERKRMAEFGRKRI
jgi:glycosyltransferase involved in cell wall biosynthesis